MSVMESTQIQASQGTGTVTESGENVQEYRREFKNEQPMDSHHFGFPLKEEQNFTGEPTSQTTQKWPDNAQMTATSAQPVAGRRCGPPVPPKPVTRQQPRANSITRQQPRANSTTSTIQLDLPVEIDEQELESSPGFFSNCLSQCQQIVCGCCACTAGGCALFSGLITLINCCNEDDEGDDGVLSDED